MATPFPTTSCKFVGRDDYLQRFRARVEHFYFFVYEGLGGSGKTSLLLKLGKECSKAGILRSIYLRLAPGETIGSILARVEAKFKRSAGSGDHQGDPYARLLDLLDANKTALLLDNLHHLRTEDVPSLCRSVRARPGQYRIISASREEPHLPATERSAIHVERMGPLSVEAVTKVAAQYKFKDEALEMIIEDAKRGGCVCHPLTLTYMLSLCGKDLPPQEFLGKQTARSINAFKAVMAHIGHKMPQACRTTLVSLVRIRLPISKTVAQDAFGATIERLIKGRLLDVIDGDVRVHRTVAQWLSDDTTEMSLDTVQIIAKHLHERAVTHNEPIALARAGELLAGAGAPEDAIKVLSEGWEAIRDLGFLEGYLQALASVRASPELEPRVKLLSARARMRKANPAWVQGEMEALSESADKWTKVRALGALSHIYSTMRADQRTVEVYDHLQKITNDAELIFSAGNLAAVAYTRLGELTQAEKLAKKLVTGLKGKKQYDREGELHRLLSKVYAQTGQLKLAVSEAQATARSFERAGDLYHAATALGFIGDLYRETGDFELAKEAFSRFHAIATDWGDRDLIHIADLAEAWVDLDVGDLTAAASRIEQVEKVMSAAPSKRLSRYLEAAHGMLHAGRGQHRDAVGVLRRVVIAWDEARQAAIADILRAQLVRSLIANGDLDGADDIVQRALSRLNPKTAAPRVAMFLRESALIRLRRKDPKRAMEELRQARALFAAGGNRREEALTLHRIAHAAFEENDLELATERAEECLTLGKSIHHARAVALARELQGRIALMRGDGATAVESLKESAQSLRKLGDQIGALHVSEWLLRALLFTGDLATAIRQGPRVRTQAQALGVRDIFNRALALSGAALLRKNRIDAATRCFVASPEDKTSRITQAMMWRLGEALSVIQGDRRMAAARQDKWASAIKNLPRSRQAGAVTSLLQLGLPPQDRLVARVNGKTSTKRAEDLAFVDADKFDLYIDVSGQRIVASGVDILLPSDEAFVLLRELAVAMPSAVSFERLHRVFFDAEPGKKPERRLVPIVKQLEKALRGVNTFKIEPLKNGFKMSLPKKHALMVPTYMAAKDLSDRHREIMRILGEQGTTPLQIFQDRFELTRSAARKELAELMDAELVEAVREGRGQAFRLC